MDLLATWTAAKIIDLIVQKVIESSAGKLTEKFTETAISKFNTLHQKIADKLRGKTSAEAALTAIEQGNLAEKDRLIAYLQVAMDEDPQFATEVKAVAQEIHVGKIQDNSSMTMNNYDNARGWQTRVEGGTAYVGEIHIHGKDP